MKKLKNYFKAFTLVELIIVITILAILATIAFISFKNFTSNARDGNRVATVTQIEKGLNLIQLKSGNYPNPDGEILTGALNLGGSELVYSSMGIIDENISRMINMSKTPLDPVSNSKYVYAVNNKQDKYQITTLLESLEANTKLPLIEQTYANENYRAKVVGNHEVNVKISTGSYTYLTTIPSMIFTGTGNILNSSGTYHIINGGQNLPYKTNDKIITSKETGDKIIQHIRKSQDAKIITVDITDIVKASNETTRKAKIEEIFGTGNTPESKELLASIGAITGTNETLDTNLLTQAVESIITGGSVSSASNYTAPKKSCDGILDGQTKTFWNIPNVNYGQTCPAGVEFTCNNGNWESQGYNKAEYIHICSVGEASNCTSQTIDDYEVGEINHSSEYNAEKIVNIANGTLTYKQIFTCNNGTPEKTGTEEILTPNCNTNYVANGNTCVLDTCTGTLIDNAELNGTQGTATWQWSQTEPGLCKYKCIDGYDTSSCIAKTKAVTSATHNSRNYTFTNFTLTYNSPQTKTSQTLNITNGTATLTAKFTLEADGTTVNLSEQNEVVTCNTNYTLNNGNCEGNSYTVTFDSQGGNTITSKSVIYGNTYGTLTAPTRTGYTFNGWFTATSGGTQVTSSTNVTATANHTIYAQWTATQYTVTLNADGGSGGSTSVTATYNSAMPSITLPTKSGCTFNGYFTSTNGAGTQYYTSGGTSARNYDIASSTTLYAGWINCIDGVSQDGNIYKAFSYSPSTNTAAHNYCKSLGYCGSAPNCGGSDNWPENNGESAFGCSKSKLRNHPTIGHGCNTVGNWYNFTINNRVALGLPSNYIVHYNNEHSDNGADRNFNQNNQSSALGTGNPGIANYVICVK